jgi:hypothetical protein
MSHVTLTQAAKFAGRARSTLHRACTSGRISFTRGDGGARMIDVAELERVYGPLRKQTAERTDAPLVRPSDAHHAEVRAHQALADQREAHLTERIDELRERAQELRTDRDSWKAEAESWRTQAERLLLTTREHETKRAGWWSRLFGS